MTNPPDPKTKTPSDNPENLWVSLLKITALMENLDISHVPECVFEHLAQRDMTIREALNELTK